MLLSRYKIKYDILYLQKNSKQCGIGKGGNFGSDIISSCLAQVLSSHTRSSYIKSGTVRQLDKRYINNI